MEKDGKLPLYTTWLPEDTVQFNKSIKLAEERIRGAEIKAYQSFFTIVKKLLTEDRKKKAVLAEKAKVVEILKTSTRCHRSVLEKETLRKFIINNLTCIPSKELSFSEMDKLCNEVDWFPYVGRAIVFLQGDFGNCYYMVASGAVGLYLESSKDREMILGREYGKLRGQPLPPDLDVLQLGTNIFNVLTGNGFGEFAILSTTQKLRSCAAVTNTDDTILLIMHGETYDVCLRKFHFKQRTLSTATKLLQGLPLFSYMSYSKISQVAYTMKSLNFSSHSIIITVKAPLKSVFLIAKGQVKVFPPKSKPESKHPLLCAIEKRLPALAVCMLGKGQIIGTNEVHKGSNCFEMTYVADASGCELFEMPLQVYVDHLNAPVLRVSKDFQAFEEVANIREVQHAERIDRATHAMKVMMSGTAGQAMKKKQELLALLPNIVEEPGFTCNDFVATGAGPPPPTMATIRSQALKAKSSSSSGSHHHKDNTMSLEKSARSRMQESGPGVDDFDGVGPGGVKSARSAVAVPPESPRRSMSSTDSPRASKTNTGRVRLKEGESSSGGSHRFGAALVTAGGAGGASVEGGTTLGWKPNGSSQKNKMAGAIRSFIEKQVS